MKDRDIDEILKAKAQEAYEVDQAALGRITDTVKPSLRPVRPLPATWMLVASMVLVCATVAIAGAARAGFDGFENLGWWQRVLIFSTLGLLVPMTGMEFVHEMIPGSRRLVSPRALLLSGCAALLVVFGLLFRDYHTTDFFAAGIACLFAGFVHAVPAALISWLVLRRGFAVNPVAAGFTAGMLGGLAGITMLELHCPNFEVSHILVWHTAVVPFSSAVGTFVAWAIRLRTRER